MISQNLVRPTNHTTSVTIYLNADSKRATLFDLCPSNHGRSHKFTTPAQSGFEL